MGVRDRANKGATSRQSLKVDQKPLRKRQNGATLAPRAFEGMRASKGGETKKTKVKKAPRIRTRTQAFKLGHVKGKGNGKSKDV